MHDVVLLRFFQKFELGIADIVEHFRLESDSSKLATYAFNRANLLVSDVKVEGGRIKDFSWDVYRFLNASTNEYLTACVGRDTSAHGTGSILHVVKGEVYPDASFAEY